MTAKVQLWSAIVAAALAASCSATGRRSYVVTSTLTASDGSASVSPMSHAFTMIVDEDTMTAIAGAYDHGEMATIERAAEGFRARFPIDLRAAPAVCHPTVRYYDLTFSMGESGPLVGHGSGELTINNGGVRTTTPVTMSLTGVPDGVPPTLRWPGLDDVTDPFEFLTVVSSEPLPDQPAPLLRTAGGDVNALVKNGSTGPFGVYFSVQAPAILRRYGEQYTVDISGVRDFAGNGAFASEPEGLTVTTRPAPPLVARDGFESVTDATLGGAQVLSGAGDPVITGTRSLYVPGPALGSTENFAVRVPVRPGARVKLAYRYVNGYRYANGDSYFFYSILFASVGGSIWVIDLPHGDEAVTAGVIGGTQVMLGPIKTATIPLPSDASDEIVIHHSVRNLSNECEEPIAAPPLPGLIFDDLRDEF